MIGISEGENLKKVTVIGKLLERDKRASQLYIYILYSAALDITKIPQNFVWF
jgi:hypothetical protein